MTIIIALHIIFMFIAFAFTNGVGIALTAIAATQDVRSIRTASRAMRPFNIAGGIVLLIGIVLGFGAAQAAGYPLSSRWLIITYIAVALILVMAFALHAPWSARLRTAAEASPEDKPSAALLAVIGDPLVRIAGPITGLLWLTVISMMVFKPA